MKYCYRKHLLLQPSCVHCNFRIMCLKRFAKLQHQKERPGTVMRRAGPVVLAAAGSPLGHIFPICTDSSRWNQSCSICGLVYGFF